MKVSIDGVEYNVYSIDDFLAVQKVLTGSFTALLSEQALNNCRERVLEEYWDSARTNNDVQREIVGGVTDIPAIYDEIVDDAIGDTGYSSLDDLTYDLSRMKETFDDIRNLADDWI